MRVYIPATVPILQQLVTDGSFFPLSGTAFAVTPALREAYAEGDDDDLAEIALEEAARASLRLLAGAADSGHDVVFRRAVIAADVTEATPRPDLDDSVVRLSGPVTIQQVASAHVDTAEAMAAVETAIEVIDEADLGDPDAEFVLGAAADHALAWYARQELPFLLDLM
jgi:hypothetical protein